MRHPVDCFLPSRAPAAFDDAYRLGHVSGVPADVYNQCKAITETSKWGTKAEREESTKKISQCTANAACTAYSGGNIPPGVCGTVVGPVIDTATKIWNSLFGDDEEAAKARKRRRDVAAYFSAYEYAVYFDQVIDRLLSAAAARLIQFSDSMRQAGLLGGGQSITDKEFCWPVAGEHKCIEGPLPWRSNDQKARKALLDAGLPLVIRKEHWNGTEFVDNLFWFSRLSEYAKWLSNKAGVVAATSWMKANAQKNFDDWQEKIAKAEMIVRAQIIGAAAADQKIGVRADQGGSTSWSTLGTVAKGAAIVTAVGIGLAVWKPALLSTLKRAVLP